MLRVGFSTESVASIASDGMAVSSARAADKIVFFIYIIYISVCRGSADTSPRSFF